MYSFTIECREAYWKFCEDQTKEGQNLTEEEAIEWLHKYTPLELKDFSNPACSILTKNGILVTFHELASHYDVKMIKD